MKTIATALPPPKTDRLSLARQLQELKAATLVSLRLLNERVDQLEDRLDRLEARLDAASRYYD